MLTVLNHYPWLSTTYVCLITCVLHLHCVGLLILHTRIRTALCMHTWMIVDVFMHCALYMQSVETQLASVGNIMKSEHDIGMCAFVCWTYALWCMRHAHWYPVHHTCTDDYGNLTGYVLYESVEQAQRAESTFNEEESMFKVSAKQTTTFLTTTVHFIRWLICFCTSFYTSYFLVASKMVAHNCSTYNLHLLTASTQLQSVSSAFMTQNADWQPSWSKLLHILFLYSFDFGFVWGHAYAVHTAYNCLCSVVTHNMNEHTCSGLKYWWSLVNFWPFCWNDCTAFRWGSRCVYKWTVKISVVATFDHTTIKPYFDLCTCVYHAKC